MSVLTELSAVTVIMFIVAASCTNSSLPVRYDNYAVYKVQIRSNYERDFVLNLSEQTDKYSIWLRDSREIHIMVSPAELQNFVAMMKIETFIVELLIPNVQALIDEQSKKAVDAGS